MNLRYRKQGLLTSEAGESSQQIGFIAGAVAAVALAYFTGGTSVYAYLTAISIGGAIGAFAASMIDPVKPKEATNNVPMSGIKDFYVTSAALGQMIPVLYGTFRIPGNIIQASRKAERIVATPVTVEQPGQKGKGGGEDVQYTFSKAYSITMALGLCEGVILAVDRIWIDLDLFYDKGADLGHLRYGSEDENAIYFSGVNKSVTELIVYKGTETQPRDEYLVALVSSKSQLVNPDTGEFDYNLSPVPAYRGLAYAVLADFDLGASGRVPNFTFEVVRERASTERPVDIALIDGGAGLHVLYAKDMAPQLRIEKFWGLYVLMRTEPSNNDNGVLLEGPDAGRNWVDFGIAAGDTITIEGALIAANNRTTTVLSVNGAYMSLAKDAPFSEDHNQIDVTVERPPLHTKDREGILRSYQAPRLQELTQSARSAGIFPLRLATCNDNGQVSSMVGVLLSGTLDAVFDPTVDSLYMFINGGNQTDIYGGPQPLRTSNEENNGTRLGLGEMVTNGGRRFYIVCTEINAIVMYDMATMTAHRGYLGSKPQHLVWSPFGGGDGSLYVVREGDTVTRFEAGPGMLTQEEFQVGAGSGYGEILRAALNNRVWVSNNWAGTLSHFTTAGDVGTVSVIPNPTLLVEARDGFIWVASSTRGEMSRINPTTYEVVNLEVADLFIDLAPAQGSKIWAISKQSRSAIYLIAPDGTYDMLVLPFGASKVVADTSGDPARDGYAYVMCVEANTVVAVAPDCSRFTLLDSGAGLARCVRELSVKAGLTSDRVDTSGLLNTGVNFILSEVASAKDTLNLLAETYNFRFVETEGFVRYYYNYAIPTLAEISENVLAGGIDKEDAKSLGVSRLQERELPTRVSVTYVSAERNYQDRAEIVQLTSGNIEQNPQVYRYPFAMTPEDAYQLAEIKLFEPWAQRERTEFTLPPLFLLLDPGDAVDITARDIRYNIRLNEITRARTWLHTVRGLSTYPPVFLDPALPETALRALKTRGTVSVRAVGGQIAQTSLYQDTIARPGVSLPLRSSSHPSLVVAQAGTGLITLQNPSRMAVVLVEPPALTPSDIVLRAYLGTYRTQPERDFSPTTLYRSPSGTIDFSYAASDSTESSAGEALTQLPDVENPFVWDMTSTVDIKMRAGSLRMVSQLDVLNGQNRAMLGKELIQFARATLQAPGVYRLSQLLRGRLGTESFTGTHTVGEGFVLLDSNTIRDTYLFERQIVDKTYFYRVVDGTTGLTSAATFEQVVYGNALKPWAPVLRGVIRNAPSPGDVMLTWLYRSRLAPDLLDYSGISWDIDFTKQFHVRIYTDATYGQVKNTYFMEVFIGSAEALLNYTYTEDQQIADFGSAQATVYYGIIPIGAQNVLGYEARGLG